ncbi:TIGR01841 family phasin [Paraburkholderia tagetis]|uniref:TIGR01841 family phasin n=1 Tax=Paraburkholderia tagetis TaxID=2913261 RepID=A0A9X1UP89_9BURK|nr:TIGR01841 family phasin [Paraburkholderia tagetis]MCG5079061.1 TIGR01841 family phasin [Paraburkholderia tagetis]
MTVFSPEEYMAFHGPLVETWFAAADATLGAFEAVADLNAQLTRAVLAEWEDDLNNAADSTNPVAFFTQKWKLSQQAVGKAASYDHHLFDIVASAQSDWTKVATAQFGHFDKKSNEWLAQVAKHPPAGSGAMVPATNSVLSIASIAIEAMRAARSHAIETAQRAVEVVLHWHGTTSWQTPTPVGLTRRRQNAKWHDAAC